MHVEKVEISSIPSFIPRPHIDITGHTMSALTVVCKTRNYETSSQMANILKKVPQTLSLHIRLPGASNSLTVDRESVDGKPRDKIVKRPSFNAIMRFKRTGKTAQYAASPVVLKS